MLPKLSTDKTGLPSVFNWNVRVYYEDTDAGGIVYYANYLKFYERARTEWLRALDIGQHALQAQHGVMFVVKSASAEYHAAAKLDDVLTLTLAVEKLGRASVLFVQQAWCGERLLNTARVKVGCVDATLRPCSLPEVVLANMRGVVPVGTGADRAASNADSTGTKAINASLSSE